MSQSRGLLLAFTIAMAVAWVAFTVVTYNTLPDTYATHFGLGGQANGFSKRSILSWFDLTFIGVASTALLLGLAQYALRKPAILNFPGKEKLLALPKDVQEPLLEQVAIWLTIVALSMVLLFSAIQYDIWRVATTEQSGLSLVSWIMLGWMLFGSTILIPIWLIRFERKIDSARDALEPQGRARR